MLKSITFFLVVVSVLLIGSSAGLVLIVLKSDPSISTNLVYFFSDLFVFFVSLTFMIGFVARRVFGAREFAMRHLKISLRQSIWFGILATVSFLLLGNKLFSAWTALFLAVSLIFLESYFLSKNL